MTTKRPFGWKLFLILTVLPCCRSVDVSIAQKEYEVARGGDVTFTCSFVPAKPITGVFVVTWEAYPHTAGEPMNAVATYFRNSPIDIAPDYEGRADMKVDIGGQSTLTLTKVTMQDSRSYQCGVMIPNDDEGTPAATTSLLVLVAPSPPICSIQGEAAYFQDITLTCMSQEGSPQPEYKWTSYSVENLPRQFPPKTTEKNGALSLFNISRETSGFFICTSSNRIGSASCNLTLAVTSGSMNVGSTAAIIGGVLAGVVLFGIIIYCCCKKRAKKDKYAEGSPEEAAYYDRDASETGEQYLDDKAGSETKKVNQYEDKVVAPLNNYSEGPAARKFDDDQHSYNSSRQDGKGSDVGSQRYQDDPRDHRRGSRDRLDDERDRYGGSRDRRDDEPDRYRGSRDRLDDQRDYRSSRDRLDDQRDHYRRSRDRLDDQRDYRSSRDRLDDQRDYRSSRDRLDDQGNRYGGSRDRLDDRRDRDDIDYIDDQSRDGY